MPAVRDPRENASPPVPYRAELIRKALHVATALVVPALMVSLSPPVVRIGLAAGAALGIAADTLRAYVPAVNRVIRQVFGSIMRAEELPPVGTRWSLNGATSVLVGAALLAVLFSLPLAASVLAAVLIADAAAALIGRQWGRHAWPGTSHTVEGSLAFVVVGCIVWALASGTPVYVGAPGIVAAAVVESVPLPINDNISVPLAAAAVLTVWGIGPL